MTQKPNDVELLLDYIMRLDPIEFTGIGKILCVSICDEEKNARDAIDIITDIVENFISANRTTRRDVLKLLKTVTKGRPYFKFGGGDSDGDTTKDK